MLKLILPILSLIILTQISTYYWWVMMASTMLLSLLSMTMIYPMIQSITMFSLSDVMSSTLVSLSILIASMMFLASSKIYTTSSNHKLFASMNILLLLTLLLCFSSSFMLSFYIWFEASLIPTMIIIMTWGYQPERVQASMYLMLYTITASLPMLAIFCMIFMTSDHMLMSMPQELIIPMILTKSSIFWLIIMGGFLVKLPMFTMHLWLPKAHVEAPIAGSMVLAAILLKLGGYGLARMMYMFHKYNNLNVSSLLMSVSLCGAVITSLICLRQPDLKSLIAYSSVGHMGLMLAGVLTNSKWGLCGALMMMIAHGLCSSGLFILANISYEITHTRSMFLTKGLMTVTPIISLWWFMFTASNMAAPPSINLMSEIMLMTSVMSVSMITIIPLGALSFLTATYSLFMYSTTQHGHISSFSNPLSNLKQKDMLLLIIHLIPICMLIVKPEMISNWM